MTKELRRIRFDEFADNLARIFSLVSRENESVVVENEEGERVVLRPLEVNDTRAHQNRGVETPSFSYGTNAAAPFCSCTYIR